MVNVVQACATWLVHHPYLLGDKECLATVVEVAELGVSGTDISYNADGECCTGVRYMAGAPPLPAGGQGVPRHCGGGGRAGRLGLKVTAEGLRSACHEGGPYLLLMS
jgi:hypothetical protein